MNYRFWRRFRMSRLIMLNVSKRGISFTITTKFLNITIGNKGIRFSSGIKGTGFSITDYKSFK